MLTNIQLLNREQRILISEIAIATGREVALLQRDHGTVDYDNMTTLKVNEEGRTAGDERIQAPDNRAEDAIDRPNPINRPRILRLADEDTKEVDLTDTVRTILHVHTHLLVQSDEDIQRAWDRNQRGNVLMDIFGNLVRQRVPAPGTEYFTAANVGLDTAGIDGDWLTLESVRRALSETQADGSHKLDPDHYANRDLFNRAVLRRAYELNGETVAGEDANGVVYVDDAYLDRSRVVRPAEGFRTYLPGTEGVGLRYDPALAETSFLPEASHDDPLIEALRQEGLRLSLTRIRR